MVDPVRAANFQKGLQFCNDSIGGSAANPERGGACLPAAFAGGNRGWSTTHEGITLVVRRLRHQHAVGGVGRLDKVVRAHIQHDLRAGQNLDIELLLQLVEHLCTTALEEVPLIPAHITRHRALLALWTHTVSS